MVRRFQESFPNFHKIISASQSEFPSYVIQDSLEKVTLIYNDLYLKKILK